MNTPGGGQGEECVRKKKPLWGVGNFEAEKSSEDREEVQSKAGQIIMDIEQKKWCRRGTRESEKTYSRWRKKEKRIQSWEHSRPKRLLEACKKYVRTNGH